MADRLAALMTHFPVGARVFNTGALCGINTVDSDGAHGQLHFVRAGTVEVRWGKDSVRVERPSLLLFPRPVAHRFHTDPERGADMVCAHLAFEGGAEHPIASALPDLICLPLDGIGGAAPVTALLFEEAFEQRCGRIALIERLIEVVMIQVLRQLMESGSLQGGLLSGLSHPRLRTKRLSVSGRWRLWRRSPECRAARSPPRFASRWGRRRGSTSRLGVCDWRRRRCAGDAR